MGETRDRVLGWLAAATLAICGLMLEAPAQAAPGSNDVARAQTLYDEGRTRYEARDYAGALDSWGDAYGLVSEAPENDRTRYELLYSIASAHDRAFANDGDPAHLRKARDLLLKCQASAGEVFAGDEGATAAELKRVRTLLDRVVDEMVEGRPAEPEPQPQPPPESHSEPATEPIARPLLPAMAPPATVTDAAPPRSGKALFGAGLGLVGAGAAGLGVMIGGMAVANKANDFSDLDANDLPARADQIQRGRLGNGLAVGGGIAAGLLVPVGIVLAVSGRTKLRVTPTASVSPRHVALGWSGRF